ncbi:MAG TPA: SRPBCC family protein [Candidatus Limnocylindrales bacterium]
MVKVTRSIVVGRAPDEVFAFLADLDRVATWQRGTGVDRVIVAGDDPVGAGTRFRLERRIGGRLVWLDCRVTTFEPPRRFGYRSREGRRLVLSVDAELVDDGGAASTRHGGPASRLDWRLELTTPAYFGPFGALIGRELGRAAERDLVTLRRLIEASPVSQR